MIIKINHYAGFTGYLIEKNKIYYISDTNNIVEPYIKEISYFSNSTDWLENLNKKFEIIKEIDIIKNYNLLQEFRKHSQTHIKNWNTGKITLVK